MHRRIGYPGSARPLRTQRLAVAVTHALAVTLAGLIALVERA
jgi:hypothetical protein